MPIAESRRIHRIPVRVVVSGKGRSAPLGQTRDLSLHGAFVATTEPLPEGSVLPLAFDLPHGAGEVQVVAEVVRRSKEGMGLQFVSPTRSAQKRIRRFVTEVTSVEGTRRTIEGLTRGTTSTRPIEEPARIAELLLRAHEERLDVVLIPADRQVRDRGRIDRLDAAGFVLATSGEVPFEPGEELFCLIMVDFFSYCFSGTVIGTSPSRLELALPVRVAFSERRGEARVAPAAGTLIRWPVPWDRTVERAYEVVDESSGGLAFRCRPETCQLQTGMPLEGAELVAASGPGGRRVTALPSAEVRHITRVVDDLGETWLHVGVAYGAERRLSTAEHFASSAGTRGQLGPLRAIKRLWSKVGHRLSFALHAGRRQLLGRREGLPFTKVRIKRRDKLEVVGLLNRAFSDEGRARCPLVIVLPAFGGRKEQLGHLAYTVVDAFRRQHQDVAVLRIDNTNSLGESSKAAGCEDEGRHTLRYTVSGVIEDLRACLEWARRNQEVDPTHLVIVSASFTAIPIRHFLAHHDDGGVGLWVSYMGAADGRNAIMHVSGHLDLFAAHVEGTRLGHQTIAGCLVDLDGFWGDMRALGIGQLADARREMAQISADVLWLLGRHDAYMDPRRVRDIMSVKAPGARELVEVDTGHLPRTGVEAIRQFGRIARGIWRHVHRTELDVRPPSQGWLDAMSQLEWQQVRRRPLTDPESWWRTYLLGADGVGFDVMEHSPAYGELLDLQVEVLDVPGAAVLELGAGTGNLTRRLLKANPARCVATDLVPDALARLEAKVDAAPGVLSCAVVDIDGSPLTAVSRALAGDLPGGPAALVERVPGVHRLTLERLLAAWDEEVHACMLGRGVDPDEVSARVGLPDNAASLLFDLNMLARVALGRIAAEDASASLRTLHPSVLSRGVHGRFEDGSFDRVAMSLVLSYLEHPDDALWEVHRVLRPGGLLVVSSLRRDAESSKVFRDLIGRFEALPAGSLLDGLRRDDLLAAARRFLDHASELVRLEEEGLFRFYEPDELVRLVVRRGFVDARAMLTFGDPPQAAVVVCRRA